MNSREKYIEDESYLFLDQKYEYFEVDKNNPHKPLSWKPTGVSNEKCKPIKDGNSPKVIFRDVWPYLKIEPFKFLAQEKITYTHESMVNLYIVYIKPDITDAVGTDIMRYGLFGATGYDTDKRIGWLWCWLWNTEIYTRRW